LTPFFDVLPHTQNVKGSDSHAQNRTNTDETGSAIGTWAPLGVTPPDFGTRSLPR
jgi:hypothetical protein